ncbi:MAG: ABC transporter ATP-binding protein/permease [Pseudomonadota bacterium]|nr:ABC transporter ATP-binding protein/permease [Pseudomonadota bacterium]
MINRRETLNTEQIGQVDAEATSIYRRALGYFAADWVWITALVALIGVSVCVGLLEAWPLAILIDSVLTGQPKGDWVHSLFLSILPVSKVGQIVGLVLLGMGLHIIGYVAWFGRMMINYRLNYQGTTRVRHDLFRKLQHLGLTYHRSRPQGDAIYRLTTDAFGPWGIMDTVIGTSVAAVTLTVMTAILLSRNASLTLAAFTVAPFMIWSNWRFGVQIHERALASKQIDADLTSSIQQAMVRVPLAQTYQREAYEFRRFRGAVGRSVRALLRLNVQEQLYPLARDSILAVGGAIILGYGGYLVYRDQFVSPVEGGMTVGLLIVFMDYVRKLWEPMKWLTEFVAKVRIFEAATRRVFRILDTPEAITEDPGAANLPIASRTLVLDQVGFAYRPSHPILHDLCATIRPGEMVAFVGPSGTGKSTLLALMLRLYDPTMGAVRLDGVDLRTARLTDIRAHMALVGQDSLMLPASIAANIAYGRPGASRTEIERAAELAGAAAFIEDLPEGYETILAEGGQNLSGGQRQRLAIARALVTRAPFLILDEPTSALDPHHEHLLLKTLRSLKGGRTIVLVTHRLESVVTCDQVFVMDAGRIVERGTHDGLLERKGHYAGMWSGADGPPDARVELDDRRPRHRPRRDWREG